MSERHDSVLQDTPEVQTLISPITNQEYSDAIPPDFSLNILENKDFRDTLVQQSNEFSSENILNTIQMVDHALCKHLNNLIESYYLDRINKCSLRKVLHGLLKGGAITLGLIAGVPYIVPSQKYANDNSFMSGLYVYSEVVSLGVLTTWLFLDILQSQQHHLAIKTSSRCFRIGVPASLGVLSAFPGTLIGLIYNKDEPMLALIALFGDVISNTCAFEHITRSYLKYRISNKQKDKKLFEQVRQKFINRMRLATNELLNMNYPDLISFLNKHHLNHDYNSTANHNLNLDSYLINLIIDLITIGSRLNDSNYLKSQNCLEMNKKGWMYFTAVVIPFGYAPTGYYMVYSQALNFIGIPIIAGLISACTFTPIYFLESYFVKNIFSKLYDLIADLVSKKYKKHPAQKNYPKLLYMLSFIGMMTSLFSFATRAQIVNDQYKDGGTYHDIVLPWTIMTVIMYKSYAMLESIPQMINHFSMKRKSEAGDFSKFHLFCESFLLSLENADITDLESLFSRENIEKMIKLDGLDGELMDVLKQYQSYQRETTTMSSRTVNPPMLLQFNEAKTKNGSDFILKDHDKRPEDTILSKAKVSPRRSLCEKCIIL